MRKGRKQKEKFDDEDNKQKDVPEKDGKKERGLKGRKGMYIIIKKLLWAMRFDS